MSEHTPIQWCDSTVNPVMGCSGCELWFAAWKTCYAGVLHELRGGHNPGFAPVFTKPTLFPGRAVKAARWRDLTGKDRPEKPWLGGLPRLIFISDMGDALAEKGVQDKSGNPVRGGVPFEFLKTEIIDVVLSPNGRRHRWLWLTKRPGRLAEFCEWLRDKHRLSIPPNLWLGTSVTSKATLHRAKQLAEVGDEHTSRFLSAEPLWEEISLAPYLTHFRWVIVGGESEQGNAPKEFKVEWARKLMDECSEAGVPLFLKQLGTKATQCGRALLLRDSHGGEWEEWPEDLRVRQTPVGSLASGGSQLFTRCSEITPEEVHWVWKHRIPVGEVTIVDGDPGTNKSSAMLAVAACITRGQELPGGGRISGGVLLLVGEDSVRKTVVKRLMAAGADMTRVAVMNGDVTLPENLKEIESAAVQLGAVLVIVDPFMEFLSPDSHKEQKVRRAMGPLKRLAERANLAVVLIRHLVKTGGKSPMYRGSGSIGIIAAARSGLLVAPSPDDPDMRVIAQYKSNLGPVAESLLFEPVANGDGVVRIEWRGTCQFTAKDLLATHKNGEGKLEEAKALLLELLRRGPRPLKELQREAERHGISFRTLERAKLELGIVSRRKGFGRGSEVYWELPKDGGQ